MNKEFIKELNDKELKNFIKDLKIGVQESLETINCDYRKITVEALDDFIDDELPTLKLNYTELKLSLIELKNRKLKGKSNDK